MAKYLLQVSYTTEGSKGVQKEGGTSRRKAAQALVESVGGTLEALYFAFGDCDVFAIADFPDNASAAAAALAVATSGAATAKTTVLITTEEMDLAAKKSPAYRAPGR